MFARSLREGGKVSRCVTAVASLTWFAAPRAAINRPRALPSDSRAAFHYFCHLYLQLAHTAISTKPGFHGSEHLWRCLLTHCCSWRRSCGQLSVSIERHLLSAPPFEHGASLSSSAVEWSRDGRCFRRCSSPRRGPVAMFVSEVELAGCPPRRVFPPRGASLAARSCTWFAARPGSCIFCAPLCVSSQEEREESISRKQFASLADRICGGKLLRIAGITRLPPPSPVSARREQTGSTLVGNSRSNLCGAPARTGSYSTRLRLFVGVSYRQA